MFTADPTAHAPQFCRRPVLDQRTSRVIILKKCPPKYVAYYLTRKKKKLTAISATTMARARTRVAANVAMFFRLLKFEYICFAFWNSSGFWIVIHLWVRILYCSHPMHLLGNPKTIKIIKSLPMVASDMKLPFVERWTNSIQMSVLVKSSQLPRLCW